MGSSIMLIFDAAINFLLGFLLLLTIPFPEQIPKFLGLPEINNPFYTSILGTVLCGIGIALVMESHRSNPGQLMGLNLGGAVAINLCGAVVLLGWLLLGVLNLPLRGQVFLWVLSLTLITVSGFELLIHFRKKISGEL